MKVRVNGEIRDFPSGFTLLQLLEALAVPSPQVAVEVNAQVVRRAHHAEKQLQEGDQVEIVTFVGGG